LLSTLPSKSIPPNCVAEAVTNVTTGTLALTDVDAEIGNLYAACPNGTACTGAAVFKFAILMYLDWFTQSPDVVILPSFAIDNFLSPITLAI